jgi:hypothetical protein
MVLVSVHENPGPNIFQCIRSHRSTVSSHNVHKPWCNRIIFHAKYSTFQGKLRSDSDLINLLYMYIDLEYIQSHPLSSTSEFNLMNTRPSCPGLFLTIFGSWKLNGAHTGPSATTSTSDITILSGPQLRLSCPFSGCTRRFLNDYTRSVHMRSHGPKKRWTCSHCEEQFTRQHDRFRHEVVKHGYKSKWSCDKCRGFFSSVETLRKHRCLENGRKRWRQPSWRPTSRVIIYTM